MGRIWGTIYRIRVEIVIASSEYRGCLILLQYCVCSLFFACRRVQYIAYILLLCSGYTIVLTIFSFVYSLVSVAGRPVGGEEE